MGKILLLTKSNFRRNKGTSVGLFLLMMIAATLIGAAMLLLLDAYPTATKEAERLHASEAKLSIVSFAGEIEEESLEKTLEDLMDGTVSRYEIQSCLGYFPAVVPFANGERSVILYVDDRSAFEGDFNRNEIIVEDTEITDNYVYLPYQYFTSGDYELGDAYVVTLAGKEYEWKIRGFFNSIYSGCNNSGEYEFVVDDKTYQEMREKDKIDADAVQVPFDMKEGKAYGSFAITLLDQVQQQFPYGAVTVTDLDSVVFDRTFMSLIIVISFLIVTVVLVCAVALMLANVIANYIRENMKTIGALKAIGYTGMNIKASLYLLFAGLAAVAALLGIGVSYALMPFISQFVVAQMGLPYQVTFNAAASLIPFAFVILFVLFVCMCAVKKIGKIEPIVALREGMATHNFKKNHAALDKSVLGLNVSLSFKTLFGNMKQNVITFVVMGLLVFICVISLLMFENFNRNPKLDILTFETCGGVVTVEHSVAVEARDYLETFDCITNVRELSNANIHYKDEDTLLAYVIDNPEQLNNKNVLYRGRLPKYDNEIAVSGKFAKNYGLEIGDEAQMVFGGKAFNYLITGFIQSCNNAGREAFLTKEAAAYIIDFERENSMYWFDCDDSETAERIFDAMSVQYDEKIISTLNFYDIMEGNMSLFKSVATLMLVLMCGISAAVILLVLYLLIKALIFDKGKEYGIYKAMGYTTKDLMLQTALSFMPAIVLSVIVFSVVSYFTANPYMSTIMGLFGLMKCTFVIPVGGVVIIGAGMILLSFLFAMFEARKIKKIEPYQMLIGE